MEGWALVLTALFGSGGLVTAAMAVWKAAKTAAKNEILAEDAEKTIARLEAVIDKMTGPGKEQAP